MGTTQSLQHSHIVWEGKVSKAGGQEALTVRWPTSSRIARCNLSNKNHDTVIIMIIPILVFIIILITNSE